MEKTKPTTTKARIHQSKEMYYNTKKAKARFSRFLRHPAWKWSGSVLKGKMRKKDKWGSLRYKQANITGWRYQAHRRWL